jgi:hypothetical protein
MSSSTVWNGWLFRYTVNMDLLSDLPAIPFIPPESQDFALPLERFLPPCPSNVIASWLRSHYPPGTWVVDALASNPLTSIQIAQAGYRVLTNRSHPLLHFMLEILAKAPKENDFQRAMNEWLRTRVGTEPLSIHLQSLYETICPGCGQKIQAQGFIWENEHDIPRLRLVDCPKCGQKGEFPLSQFDLDKLVSVQEQKKKTRARARQRVLLGLEGSLHSLEDAMNCYLERPLYFLMTCINKVDGLMVEDDTRHLLQALLLHLMDAGNNLWHWPPKVDQPHTLNPPTEFLEKNLWVELQNAIHYWKILNSPLPVSHWPAEPPASGGICLYQRKSAILKEMASNLRPMAMAANFSRPNPAWLTFSVLWSGWLWGLPAVERLRQSLEYRRYDWRWMAGSLQTALQQNELLLPGEGKLFGVIDEASPSSLFAIQCAARRNQMKLDGMAMRSGKQFTQLQWVLDRNMESDGKGINGDDYANIILVAMSQKGEPLDNDEVMTICRMQHALCENLPADLHELNENLLDDHQVLIKNILQNNSIFLTLKNPNVPGGTQWWMSQQTACEEPIIDRMEKSILNYLQKGKPIPLEHADQLVCRELQGSFIPSKEAVQVCLESYANKASNQADKWILRQEDQAANRANEISKAINTLKYLGVKLGWRMEGENPLTWLDNNGEIVYQFFIIGSAIFNQFLIDKDSNEKRGKMVIVFPSSRSRLILYKLKNNALWQTQIEQSGGMFLKMRHLFKVAAQVDINQAIWEMQLDADPPAWDPPVQLQIL